MTTNLQQYCSICTLLNVTHSKVTAVKTINNEQKTLQPTPTCTKFECTGSYGRYLTTAQVRECLYGTVMSLRVTND